MIEAYNENKRIIEELYSQIKAGIQIESKNIELKREWYNLDPTKKGDDYKTNVSKFIKEIGALANSYGPWNGYLIIGLGEDGTVKDSPLSVSGLKDESELYSLVVSCIDKPIRFEYSQIIVNLDGFEKIISVITVPVSIDKPHVMYEYVTKNGRYENYTPVRKGTTVRSASRSDLDLMYYDKQNIIPEYAIKIGTYNGSALQIREAGASVSLDIPIVFENYGRKPMVIVNCNLIISESEDEPLKEEIILTLGSYSIANKPETRADLNQQPIIIGSNNTIALTCHFYSWKIIHYKSIKSGKLIAHFSAKDIFENTYNSPTFRTGALPT